MLQALLEGRFHLKAHHETKELPVYTLIVSKRGPKLADARDSSLCNGNGCFGVGNGVVLASGGTMDRTAEVLTQLVDRPVLDRTGLAGHYDFQLHFDQSSVKPAVAGLASAPTDGPSIFGAVEELGLKLEPTRAQVEMLVIDSVERPTPD